MVGRKRIAAAPISWGICEVPDWGFQMASERVLAEMASLGINATEFGPEGFLPDQPSARASMLAYYGLTAVGGFLPVVLHDGDSDPLPIAERFLETCVSTGASVMVLAADSGMAGYEVRPTIDDTGWTTLLANLELMVQVASDCGITAVLHPHLGTIVEGPTEVERVLAGSAIGICLDTGHLLAGGTDPVWLTREHSERIAHVHLKDVDAGLASELRDGRVGYNDAVDRGMYRPLGQGDIDIRTIVSLLENRGYDGWYVLEQDVMLSDAPAGEGPILDVRDSLNYLRKILT